MRPVFSFRILLFTLACLVAQTANAGAATTYYVSLTGSNANPGTFAQPVQTIQHAIDSAVSGDTIVVEDGTFTGPGNVDLTALHKYLTIESQNGPSKTFIDCAGSAFDKHVAIYIGIAGSSQNYFNVSGFTIENSYATTMPAIELGSCYAKFTNCNIINNQYGTVDVTSDSHVTFQSCQFTGNSHGTSIIISRGYLTMDGCTLSGNDATYILEGIIYPTTITNSTFDHNSGSVLHASTYAVLNLTGCTISNTNGGPYNGAAILSDGKVTITGCTFSGNKLVHDGGAIWSSRDLTISQSKFLGNSAYNGGAIYTSGTATIDSSIFDSNALILWPPNKLKGGAIWNQGTATITNCIFTNNGANCDDGGAIANFAPTGGAENLSVAFSVFDHNTAKFNPGHDGGDDIAQDSTSSCLIADNIFWAPADLSTPIFGGFGTGTEAYNDIPVLVYNPDDFSFDPLYVDQANGNYHLQAGSQAIRKGTAVSWEHLDFNGNARSNPPSLGAYEVGPRGLTASASNASVALSWGAVPGSNSYTVYRGTSAGHESATPLVENVGGTSYLDTTAANGTTYYYKVAFVNAYGTGPQSDEASATPIKPAASFVGVDVTTQGNWRDKYGVNGYNVISDASTNNPHYGVGISVTPGSHSSGAWATSSLSPACLQTAASGGLNRLAGIWFQTSWTMNVNIASTHSLELYLLDYPNAGYAETITIKDAVTGAVLNTQTASNFQGGKYYIWNVSGNVNVTFTSTAGHWAVLSGIFIGGATGSKSPTKPTNLVATQTATGIGLTWTASTGATSYNVYHGTAAGGESTTPIATGVKTTAYTSSGLAPGTYYYKVVAVNSYACSFASNEASAVAPSPTSTAAFVKTDTTTKGNWKGVYGLDGYNVIGDVSGTNPSYPAYATVTPGTHTSGIWATTSADTKCLQKVANGSTDRMAGVWYQTSWSMGVNVTGTHKLALYFLDYPNAGYAETVTIKDTATGVILDTRSVSSFQTGVYEVWNVSGNVTVTLTSTAGHWAPVSGIFFG